MKTVITNTEKLQLLGLLTLAQQHQKVVGLAEEAMCALLEHDEMSNYADQLSDAIYEQDTNIDKILENMGVKVESPNS